jgi:hypothetical protein
MKMIQVVHRRQLKRQKQVELVDQEPTFRLQANINKVLYFSRL